MDMGKQFEQLLKRVEQDDRGKEDKIVSFGSVRMNPQGLIETKGRNPLQLTDHATTQVFSKLGIPVRYAKRLMEERPELVADQFNHWVRKEDGDVLLRMRKANGQQGLIRAVLSDRYSILDNKDVMVALQQVVNELPQAEILQSNLNDRITNIRLAFPELTAEFDKTVTGEKDLIKVGVDIDNSEIGVSSLRVMPVTYRLVCTNGMRAWVKDGDLFEQRHIHLTSDELYMRMSGAIVNAIKAGDGLIKVMRQAKGIKVASPLDLIKELAQKEEYSKKLTDALTENFMIEPENNIYGVINAFTRTARDIENTERRLDLEEYAGNMLMNLVAA